MVKFIKAVMLMVQGQRVSPRENLVPYNVRLEKEVKQILNAIVQVQKLPGGQRELIDLMLAAYQDKYPTTYQKAVELVKLINSEN
jgi:hypothetical protein